MKTHLPTEKIFAYGNSFHDNIILRQVTYFASKTNFSYSNTISYPLFVHVIRKDIYGGVSYHMRPEAECVTAPHHRYLPYCVEQAGDNEFIIY